MTFRCTRSSLFLSIKIVKHGLKELIFPLYRLSTDDFVVNGGVSKDFFLCFLEKNAFHHLYHTETGRSDVLVVFGIIRPKLEPRL